VGEEVGQIVSLTSSILSQNLKIRNTRAWTYSGVGAVQEVEITRGLNEIMDIYRAVYRARYNGREPIIRNLAAAQTFIKDLIRNQGVECTAGLVRRYLKMNGDKDWFINNGHSLSVLEKNIEAVNGSLGLTGQAFQGTSYDPTVTFEGGCPRCSRQHEIVCKASQMAAFAYTVICKKCQQVHLQAG
jgi:hypothetical protein